MKKLGDREASLRGMLADGAHTLDVAMSGTLSSIVTGLATARLADAAERIATALEKPQAATLADVVKLARSVLETNNEECLDALDLCEQLEVILLRQNGGGL